MESLLEQFKDRSLTLPPLPAPYIATTSEHLKEFDNDKHLQSTISQPFGVSEVFNAKLISFSMLVKNEDVKTVYEINLEVPPEITYKFLPGDTIGILTNNLACEVDLLVKKLGLCDNNHYPLKVEILPGTTKKNPKLPVYIPKFVTVEKLIRECLDIRCIPKKLLFRSMIPFVCDNNEKRFLEILCSKEGASVYDDLIVMKGLHFVDFVKIYLSKCNIPIAILIEHLPRLMPRPYSIANSPLINSNRIRIIFTKVDGPTTNMLETLGHFSTTKDIYIPTFFRQRNNFVYHDTDLGRNVIMIGPGTGLSPFIGFMEHREKQLSKSKGRMWLYIGCRYKDRSYFYRDQIEGFMKNGTLTKLSEAFSRDLPSQVKYVQDQILKNQNDFIEWLIMDDTKLYVCGGVKMLPQIQDTIVNSMAEVLRIDQKEAKNKISDMKKENKYIEDIWI